MAPYTSMRPSALFNPASFFSCLFISFCSFASRDALTRNQYPLPVVPDWLTLPRVELLHRFAPACCWERACAVTRKLLSLPILLFLHKLLKNRQPNPCRAPSGKALERQAHITPHAASCHAHPFIFISLPQPAGLPATPTGLRSSCSGRAYNRCGCTPRRFWLTPHSHPSVLQACGATVLRSSRDAPCPLFPYFHSKRRLCAWLHLSLQQNA